MQTPAQRARRHHADLISFSQPGWLRALRPKTRVCLVSMHRARPATPSPCRKGISKSALPYRRTPPSWFKQTPGEVIEHVCKLAKKGLTPSQIGVNLRDSHGVAQVAHVTGSKILRILKKKGTLSPHPHSICSMAESVRAKPVTVVCLRLCGFGSTALVLCWERPAMPV